MKKVEYEKIDTKYKLLDDKVFTLFMRNKDIAKTVIEIILNKNITELTYINTEETVKNLDNQRGVRYGVFCKDVEEKYYDIELQVATQNDLMERFRLYQSRLDQHTIQTGETYGEIRETYIIFICDFDYLKKNKGIYNIVSYCKEAKEICNDKSNRILFNLKGAEFLNENIKDLAILFKENEYNKNNKTFEKLAERFKEITSSKDFIRRYTIMMTKEMELINKGKDQAKVEIIETYIKNLQKKGLDNNSIIKDTKISLGLSEDLIRECLKNLSI